MYLLWRHVVVRLQVNTVFSNIEASDKAIFLLWYIHNIFTALEWNRGGCNQLWIINQLQYLGICLNKQTLVLIELSKNTDDEQCRISTDMNWLLCLFYFTKKFTCCTDVRNHIRLYMLITSLCLRRNMTCLEVVSFKMPLATAPEDWPDTLLLCKHRLSSLVRHTRE